MKISWRISSDLAELDGLLDKIQTLETKWCLTKKTLAETALILDELITNTIEHGHCDKKNPIDVTLTKTGQKLTIEIVDSGHPFDPTLCTLPKTDIPLEKRKCGGLGLLLIKKFSDRWNYSRSKDKNILTLQKNLPKECREQP